MLENDLENWQMVLDLERQGTPMNRQFADSNYKTTCCVPRFSKGCIGELKNLCLVVHSFYPKIKTKNPYRRLAQKVNLPNHLEIEKHLELFDELVHAITAINHLYRVKTKQGYESTREDVMIAVQLLSPKIYPYKFITKSLQSTYNALHELYNTNTQFKVGEAHKRLRMARRTMKLHIDKLEKVGLIKTLKKDRYRGDCYILNPIL